MNRIRIHTGLIFSLLLLLMTACEKNEPDSPPLNMPGDQITLAELRAMYNGQPIRFEGNTSVFATVSMDQQSGNIYRAIYIDDGTAAINVRLDFATNIVEGDSVRIGLNGTTLNAYNNMLQLDSVRFGKNLVIQGKATPVEPISVSIPQILSGGYQARLVQLDGVQFSAGELGKTFANVIDGTSENRDLADCSGNRIIVRTSPFAEFANHTVPEGNGRLLAVVSQFGNTWQLLLRSDEELDMNGERCDTDEPLGSGSFDDPYNVAHAISFNSGVGVWVEGYIVGVIDTSDPDNFVPVFSAPFNQNTNLLIADSPDETSLANTLPVQLPFGEIREALNLMNNPENLGKQVKILGDLSSYFSQPGLRTARGYWMDGEGVVPQTGFYTEEFATSLSPYTTHNLLGQQDWVHATWDGGCAYMSGYGDNANQANENWLVSPQIDLSERSQVRLSIREAINFMNEHTSYDDLQILVSSNYPGGDPGQEGDWEVITGFNRPPGNNWTFVDSGSVDISAFDGQSIHIAFRYLSTTSGAPAWQISKIILTESSQ